MQGRPWAAPVTPPFRGSRALQAEGKQTLWRSVSKQDAKNPRQVGEERAKTRRAREAAAVGVDRVKLGRQNQDRQWRGRAHVGTGGAQGGGGGIHTHRGRAGEGPCTTGGLGARWSAASTAVPGVTVRRWCGGWVRSHIITRAGISQALEYSQNEVPPKDTGKLVGPQGSEQEGY